MKKAISIRLDEELLERLKGAAMRGGVSMTSLIVRGLWMVVSEDVPIGLSPNIVRGKGFPKERAEKPKDWLDMVKTAQTRNAGKKKS